ncbi:hypothetical protein VNO80_13271 [Phaseolus coccineus]|uniref:Uncharacterized protein n=1 Tax=Phaseolus coccineus TaxID=3886 RepID=A0AAN9RB50_PHACN
MQMQMNRKKKNLENETLPDLASRMVRGILLLGEIPHLHERDDHGVSKNHLNGGGCDRRKALIALCLQALT